LSLIIVASRAARRRAAADLPSTTVRDPEEVALATQLVWPFPGAKLPRWRRRPADP